MSKKSIIEGKDDQYTGSTGGDVISGDSIKSELGEVDGGFYGHMSVKKNGCNMKSNNLGGVCH